METKMEAEENRKEKKVKLDKIIEIKNGNKL